MSHTGNSIPQPALFGFFLHKSTFYAPVILATFIILGAHALLLRDAFEERWLLDLRFFWTAGALWIEGISPYTSAFNDHGAANFSPIPDYFAFAYPPAVLPLLAPLGALSPKMAAYFLFAFNLALLAFSAHKLAAISGILGFKGDRRFAYLILLPSISIFFHPTSAIMVTSQIALFFTAALICFVYGVLSRKNLYYVIGLAVLLIKPQFGLALFLFGLFRKELFTATIFAGCLNAALTIIGLAPIGVVQGIGDFLSTATTYGQGKWEISANMAGLGFFLSFFKGSISTVTTLAACVIGALFVSQITKNKICAEQQMLAALVMLMTIVLFSTTNHPYDFSLLFIMLPLALASNRAVIRSAIVVGYMILAYATPFILAVSNARLDDKLYWIAGAYSVALFPILFAAFSIIFPTENSSITARTTNRPV